MQQTYTNESPQVGPKSTTRPTNNHPSAPNYLTIRDQLNQFVFLGYLDTNRMPHDRDSHMKHDHHAVAQYPHCQCCGSSRGNTLPQVEAHYPVHWWMCSTVQLNK